MKTPGLDECLAFINCEIKPSTSKPAHPEDGPAWRAVTISRQAGAGGHVMGEKLGELLRSSLPGSARPWTVFDRNLVQHVLEDHRLPKSLERFMPEDRVSELTDTLDELFGLHPPSWTLARKTAETMLRLVDLGNVIIIGRGANVVTKNLDLVFHVRLIGSEARRMERLQQANNLSPKAAREFMRREDRGRARYLKKHFSCNVEDPMLYHVVINTDLISPEKAAAWVAWLLTQKAEYGGLGKGI